MHGTVICVLAMVQSHDAADIVHGIVKQNGPSPSIHGKLTTRTVAMYLRLGSLLVKFRHA